MTSTGYVRFAHPQTSSVTSGPTPEHLATVYRAPWGHLCTLSRDTAIYRLSSRLAAATRPRLSPSWHLVLSSETTLLAQREAWSKHPDLMASTVSLIFKILVFSTLLIISVVWEYPCTPEQGRDFLALVAAIRIHLPEDRYLLTATLPAAKPVLQNIDLRQTAEYLDTLNLTAYDFFGHWTHKSGHHAQLYAMNKDEPSGAAGVKDLMASGVPGKKILLGIPLFGRSFLGVAGPGHKNRGAGGKDGSFEYNQLPRKGTKEQVDKRAVAAQCVGADGGFVTYDNPDTVKMKATFCKQKGLGVRPPSMWFLRIMLTALVVQGLFYWSAPCDAKDSKRSLIATGFKALHSS